MSLATNNLAIFLNLLADATAISLDSGPLLSDWEIMEQIDAANDDSTVVIFRYETFDHVYEESFDVGGVNIGDWSTDGDSFGLKNSDGEFTTLTFFKTTVIKNPAISQSSLLDRVEREALSQFLTEYPSEMSLEQIQTLILEGDDSVIIWQKFEDEYPTNLVEMINDMIFELRELVTDCGGDPGRTWPVIPTIQTPVELKPARVLVEIHKGLCSWNSDGNVNVHVRDLDIEPKAKIPSEFADLV